MDDKALRKSGRGFGSGKGNPKKWKSNAEKQRAYRARKRAKVK